MLERREYCRLPLLDFKPRVGWENRNGNALELVLAQTLQLHRSRLYFLQYKIRRKKNTLKE